MHLDKLTLQIKQLQKSSLGFSICQTLIFKNEIENHIGLRHEKIISKAPFEDYLMLNIVWMTPSALWKRSLLQNMDRLFDEELQAAQEWEFHCRVLSLKFNYEIINQPLVFIRSHKNSISNNNNDLNRLWHYIKARQKVAKIEVVKNTFQLTNYLNTYNFKLFKKLVLKKYINTNKEPLNYYLFTKNGLSFYKKIKCLIVVILYSKFNKGYSILNNIKLNS